MIQLHLSSSAQIAAAAPLDVQQRLEVIVSAKYRILKQLGSGGMSTVWLARHRIHGALFAIKVLHPSLAEIPELKEMFYREAIHAGVLSGHPNVVPVLDIDYADGLYYLVMPYVRGVDLNEALKHCKHFHWNDALTVMLEIATVLDYAEAHGIYHGDLTPGNIRIDEFGRVLLLDFGLSRSVRLSGLQNTYKLGTPYAMSPEQIRGDTIDIRSDLYAAGILLFELLTGYPPFQGDTIDAIEKQHLQGNLLIPPLIKQAHEQLPKLLQSLLAKEAKDRPQNAKSFEESLLQMGATHRPLNIARFLPQGKNPAFIRRRLSD
jgi:eukaryotic-like serine/threonine-protein kinase